MKTAGAVALNPFQIAMVHAGAIPPDEAEQYAQAAPPDVQVNVDFHLYDPECRVYIEDGIDNIPRELVDAVRAEVEKTYRIGWANDCDVTSVEPVLFCTHGRFTSDRRRCVTINCRNSMVAFDIYGMLYTVAMGWGFGVTRVTVPAKDGKSNF